MGCNDHVFSPPGHSFSNQPEKSENGTHHLEFY